MQQHSKKTTLTTENNRIAALWACRLLVAGSGHRRFIMTHGFRDDDLLDLIGLSHLEDADLDRRTATTKLRARHRALERSQTANSPLFSNTAHLGELLGLEAHESQVLAFLICCEIYPELKTALDLATPAYRGQLPRLLELTLGLDRQLIDRAIGRDGRLARAGLIRPRSLGFLREAPEFNLLDGLAPALTSEHGQLDVAFKSFFARSAPGRLKMSDYPHLALEIERMTCLLKQARDAGMLGLNILIYGPPGVGKTELVKVLAAGTGSRLFEIASIDEDNDPVPGWRRFQAHQLCQQLLRDSPRALVLFDEVEDVFEPAGVSIGRRSFELSKAWINKQLETNPVPTFWLSNDISSMDPAHLRRFDYVLEMGTPPQGVRRQMLVAACGDLAISQQWLDRLAAHGAVTPAQITQAARVARLISDSENPAVVEQLMQTSIERQLKLQGQPLPRRHASSASLPYRLEHVNADVELAALVAGLARQGRGSLLLYGPPGTGKTAFAQHLAAALERPLLKKTASDLLSKWLGESEQQIAQMFQQASSDGSVLLLDEADSFLRSRQSARHSWEVTQVNELLVQMENFDGVFICATNFLEITDAAALRRFDAKIKLQYLTAAQRWALLESLLTCLAVPLTPDEAVQARQSLNALDNLTPGDFATVARRAALLPSGLSVGKIVAALQQESAIKPDGQRKTIGFIP